MSELMFVSETVEEQFGQTNVSMYRTSTNTVPGTGTVFGIVPVLIEYR